MPKAAAPLVALPLLDVAFPVISGFSLGGVDVVVEGIVEDVVNWKIVEDVEEDVLDVDVTVSVVVVDVVEVVVVDVVEVVVSQDSPAHTAPGGQPHMLHFSMNPLVVHLSGCVMLHSPTLVPSSQTEDVFFSGSSHMTSFGGRSLPGWGPSVSFCSW
jgi:hypothetical protein